MKKVLLTQLIITVVGSLAITLIDAWRNGFSYLLGATLIFLNLLVMTWLWKKILQKKFIALTTTIIVFKYAIFGVIIYKILTKPEINAAWFSAGLSTLMITVIIYSLLKLE